MAKEEYQRETLRHTVTLLEKQLQATKMVAKILRALIYEYYAKDKKITVTDDVIKMAGIKFAPDGDALDPRTSNRIVTQKLFEARLKNKIQEALDFVQALSVF